MSLHNELHLEAATGLSLGAREAQEDSVLCDVPQGGGAGILVLADGLGGHAGGALASRIAVTTALRELASQRDASGQLTGGIPAILQMAAEAANHAVLAQAECSPDLEGMGTTLILTVVQGSDLYWLSVGDSPLYLIRDGAPVKLNETHSLAPHLDLLVEVGEMDAEEAATHPGRNCLTSALGTDRIERIDCPEDPYALLPGDAVLAASDGILTLTQADIAGVVTECAPDLSSAGRVARLLDAVSNAEDAEQDNTSIALLRASPSRAAMPKQRPIRFLDRVCNGLRLPQAARAALAAERAAPPAPARMRAE
ncbi:MAG: protein phosphatase 2C domain-containing protein [Pseudomonadota bacterium]